MTACASRGVRWHGLAGVIVLAGLAAVVAAPVRAAEEPGPVPLLRDAGDGATVTEPIRAAPAGLGDWRLVAALAATFAVLVGARWFVARRDPPLPPDVLEVLGGASLGGQHAVRIVRFGPKTLLVGVSAAGTSTLAELSDPEATACIAAACRGQRPPLAAGRRPVTSRGPAGREVA